MSKKGTDFDSFVQDFGVQNLARHLGLKASAVYHWLSGSSSPSPSNAFRISHLAAERGVKLPLDKIYARHDPQKLKPARA